MSRGATHGRTLPGGPLRDAVVGAARPGVATVAGLALIGAYVGLAATSLDRVPYDTAGAFLVVPFVAAAMIWLAARLARAHPEVATVVVLAVVARVAGPPLFSVLVSSVYGGSADAFAYSGIARGLVDLLPGRLLDLGPAELGGFELHGTGTVIVATGVLFDVIGPSQLGAFFVFGAFALWGQCLLYRAFRMSCPDGAALPHAWLLFLLPSVVFWTSPAGKEAWMLFFLGVTAHAVARALQRERLAVLGLVVGVVGLLLVRPHVAAIAAVAAVSALLVPRRRAVGSPRRRGRTAVVVLASVAVAVATVITAQRFLGLESATPSGVEATFDDTLDRTTIDGSSFDPPQIRSPVDIPEGVVTVLVRPLPFEADSPVMLLAAAEGVGLVGFALVGVDRLRRLPAMLRSNGYVVFALVFTLLFVVAFSYVGNFGILVRQRIQVLPFLVVLLTAAPRAVRTADG